MPGPGTWSAGDILTAADLNAIGTWTSYVPTLTQSGAVTCTVNYAKYCQINKFVLCVVDLSVTAAGTGGNNITVSTPITASGRIRGSGFFWDASATDIMLCLVVQSSTTAFGFVTEATATNTFSTLGTSPNVALANNDAISFIAIYESI